MRTDVIRYWIGYDGVAYDLLCYELSEIIASCCILYVSGYVAYVCT